MLASQRGCIGPSGRRPGPRRCQGPRASTREARPAYYVAGARACGFALAPARGSEASEAAPAACHLRLNRPIKACAHAAVLQLPVMPFACSFIFYERHSRFENVNYDVEYPSGSSGAYPLSSRAHAAPRGHSCQHQGSLTAAVPRRPVETTPVPRRASLPSARTVHAQ